VTARRRRNGRWFFRKWVRLADGTRRRVFGVPGSFGLPNTKVGAEEAERRAVQAVLNGAPTEIAPAAAPEVVTVAEFEPLYLEHSAAKNKPSALDSKRQILRDHILPALGALELGAVTFAAIEDFKHALLKKRGDRPALSAKTVNNVLTVLRRMLALAAKRGLIASVPEVEWLKADPSDFDFLSFEEADRLIDAADPEWRAMITVAVRCGLRQGELLGLRWDDVDLVGGRLLIRYARVEGRLVSTKSRKGREVELGDDAAAALIGERHLRGDYVFCDLDGHPLTAGACKHPLYRACRRAKVRRIGWHVLRHTFASHLAMLGAPLNTIRELLGHATIQMTLRYAHLSPDVRRDAVRMLDRARRGAHSVPDGGIRAGTERNTRD